MESGLGLDAVEGRSNGGLSRGTTDRKITFTDSRKYHIALGSGYKLMEQGSKFFPVTLIGTGQVQGPGLLIVLNGAGDIHLQ